MTKKTKIKPAIITDKALIFPNNNAKTTKQKNFKCAAGWLQTWPNGSSYVSLMANGEQSTVKIKIITVDGREMDLNNFYLVENPNKTEGTKQPDFFLEFNMMGVSEPKAKPSLKGWKSTPTATVQHLKPKFRANKADASDDSKTAS